MTGKLLDGQVALVTAGAGTGIGGAIVRRLRDAGASLVVTDRSAKRLDALVRDFGSESENHMFEAVDAGDESEVRDLFVRLRERFDRLDVLVNSAGFTRPMSLAEMDLGTWSEVLNVCLTSQFLHMRAALPLMIEKRCGSIVNISSVSAWSPTALGEAHYAAAKAGVLGLTRAAAAEGAPFGVRVNAVAPGLIWHENLGKALPDEYVRAYEAKSLLGHAGRPDDVADVVHFLATESSRHMTGETLTVAGGHVVHH